MHALGFQASTARLLPASARYAALYREYLQDFGELNDIVVAVDGDNGEESRRFVGRLAEALAARPDRFSRITYRLDGGFFERHGLLYLSLDTLASLRDQLFDHQEFATSYAARPSLDGLLEGINQEVGRAFVSRFIGRGLDDKAAPPNFSVLDGLLTQMEARLEGTAAPYQSPWGEFLRRRTAACSSCSSSRRGARALSPTIRRRSPRSATSSRASARSSRACTSA